MATSTRLPLLVAFDLDYTLWDLWVDTHVTPPLKRRGEELNKIYDKYNKPLSFYTDVATILLELNAKKVHIAAASRTSAPKAARQALTELLVPGSLRSRHSSDDPTRAPSKGYVSSIELFDTLEVYPGSKLAHFKEIHRKTKIPYKEMVFYDDEPRNKEVTKLGVTFVLVTGGVDRKTFDGGLESWRKGLIST